MNIVQTTAPTIECITLAELKTHLKIDSGTFAGNIESAQSIAPGVHVTTTLYSLLGTAVEVIGKQAVVYFDSGTNGATGTVDVKTQESDNGTTWSDWTGGAFIRVTTANDNATYEKAYTGTKRYIRAAAQVLLASCEFSVSVVTNSATTAEDEDLTDLITDAREEVENITGRAILTQEWTYYLDDFPREDFIRLPFGNLQSVGSFGYTDSSGTTTVLVEDTDYTVETNGDQYGRIVLPYGVSWPSATLSTSNPIAIAFTCGWTTAALVPKNIKRAVKFCAENSYYHGDRQEVLSRVIASLLNSYRLRGEF